jgi:CHAT domain-containing protein
MNAPHIILLFCLFFLYNISHTSAFQEPISPYTFSDPVLEQLINKAHQFSSQKLNEEAIQTYHLVQQKCRAANMDSISIDLYQYIFAVIVLEEDRDIKEKLERIDDIKSQEKDPNILGIYYGALAHVYLFHGESDSSQKYYDLASAIYTQQERDLQATYLNINLALEYYSFEELALAKIHLNKAENLIATKLTPRGFIITRIYQIQAAIYYELQEYEKAVESSLKQIQIYKKNLASFENTGLASSYNNLASILSQLGDSESSLDYYHAALSLIEGSGIDDPEELSYLLYNIGNTYFDQGKQAKAKAFFLKSLSLISETATPSLYLQQDFINNCHSLADCYANLQQLDSSLYYINQSAKLSEEISYRLNITYKLYGDYFLRQKNPEKATKYTLKTLEIELKIYGPKSLEVAHSYVLLAKIKNQQGQNLEALRFIQKGLETINNSTKLLNNFSNPSLENVSDKKMLLTLLDYKMIYSNRLYDLNHPSVSEKSLYQTAKLSTQTVEFLNKGMKNRKSQLLWLNKTAMHSFEKAIEIALSIYKKTSNSTYLNEAFILAERSKSMLMASKFQEGDAANLGGVPSELIQKEKQLEIDLAKANKKRFDASLKNDLDAIAFQDSIIFSYKHQIIKLLHQFEFDYPKYFKLKYAFQAIDIQAVQEEIDDQTTFIEYFEGKSNVYVFTINKQDAFVHNFKKTANYNQKVREFYSTLSRVTLVKKNPVNSYNSFVKTAHELYNILVKKSLNSTQKRLIIIPDGQLGYLPFETFLTQSVELENQSSKTVDFANLPYLIQQYKVNYNYSAGLFLQHSAHQKSSKNGQILALAPNYKQKTTPEWRNPEEQKIRSALEELPGATNELRFLEAAFKGSFLYNKFASEEQFKQEASKYSILHLAVHGLVNRKRPELSGFVLFEDNSKKEDNIFYSYEIKHLNLNTDLVVLSACETGIGQYQSGEGVLSIGRDFMAAGVPSMLSTLWNLNDHSGSIIIEQFYNNLAQGMEKDEAIRQAKLYYLEHYKGIIAHPALWACFVQFGDYNSIPISTGNNNWLFISLASLLAVFIIVFLVFRKQKV